MKNALRLVSAVALLWAGHALAADNAVIVTPGTGVTMKSKDIGGGVQAMQPILSDTSGVSIYGVAGTANANILTVQGIASMTPLLATVTGTVTANQGGTWNITNVSGTVSLPTGAATSANQSTEITALNSIVTNTGAAVPSGIARIGYTSDDPCTQKAKTNLPISQNGTSSVQLIALSGATVIYVCSLSLIAAGATTVAITTGTGSACVTGNAAVIGSTTANIANSLSFAANGGLTLGNGTGTIAQGAASSELCMINGSNVFVSGNLTYVQQ